MIKVIEIVALMFASGVITSFAEYKAQYSLYTSIVGLLKKL